MTLARKFLFDNSFDEPLEAVKPVTATPEPPQPCVGEAELRAAREDGYADGVRTGRAAALNEARELRDEANSRSLARIAEQLEELSKAGEHWREEARREALQVATTILRKLFPALAKREAFSEVTALIGECLPMLLDEKRLVLRVADHQLDLLDDRLGELARASGFEGRFVLLAEETLSDGDVRIEWADGGMERDSARLWAEVDALLERALSTDRGNATTAANVEETAALQEINHE